MDEVLRRLLPRPPPPFASTTKGGTLRSRPRGDGRAVPPESFATLAWPPKGVSFDSGMDEEKKRLLPRPPPPFASTTKGGSPCFRPREDGRAVLPESFATLAWPPKGVSFDSGMDEEEKRLLPRPRRLLLGRPKGVARASGREETVERSLLSAPRPSLGIKRGYPATPAWMKFENGYFRDPRRLLLAPPKGVPRASKREETVERSLPSAPRPSLGIKKGYPATPA